MKANMNDLLMDHAARWAKAWGEKMRMTHPEINDESEVLLAKIGKLPAYVRNRLGMALHQGILVTDSTPGRGYFVGPGSGDAASHTMLTRSGNEIAPCWEMFVHMAEYAGLHAMAREHDSPLKIGIEDAQMDLTVRVEDQLVAYIEVKHRRKQGEALARSLRDQNGKEIPPRGDRPPDWLKKANYMLDAKPRGPVAFATRAGDEENDQPFEDAFLVRFEGRQMHVEDLRDPILLHVELSVLKDPVARANACLVWSLERNGPLIVRRSEGRYVVYRDRDSGTVIVVGTQTDGTVYTDLDSLGEQERLRFVEVLGRHGLSLGDTSSGTGHRMWKREDRSSARLEDEDEARALGKELARVMGSSG